ncbi:(R)-mandelonitrile lyase [Wenxinia saemankumensis]|uniref:Cupin domain protein n=1 Tax=Wenxinia saemankumensis TaxID=1447782 RepID=A0A1M6AXP9_9RHOB|nr:cupin domain-containing protein [Wenxinia saemankumensis]SHI41098.1 Cupin domain protein [Wenxinia saemankumensis]
MDHHPATSRPVTDGAPETFTGRVRIAPVIEAPEPSQLRSYLVTFAAGARTHWHTHPLGQAIHVLSGEGRAQRDGGEILTLHPGDTVWFAPDERHWHGAGPDGEMTHIAMQEALDGKAVDWSDPVEEAHYAGTGRAVPG